MAYGSLRWRISSLGTMLTLPPCMLAGTSMAEPTTRTESTCGAISRRTATVGPAASVCVLNPGGRDPRPGIGNVWNIEIDRAIRGRYRLGLHAHAAHDGNLRAANGCAGWIGDRSLHLRREKTGGKKEATGRQGLDVVTHTKLLPRELCELTSAGRSPDLRLIEPIGLPIPSPEQWHLRKALRAYSSGAVLDFHQLPEHQRNFNYVPSVH